MKATVYDGTTTKDWTPADTQVLSADTPYVWVDVTVQQMDDPDLRVLFKDLDIDDPVFEYLSKTDLAGVFQVVGQQVVASTWAAPDSPAMHPVYVHVIWGAGSVVTVRNGGDAAVSAARELIAPRGQRLFARPSVVPAVVMDSILSSVDGRLTQIGDQMYALDEQILVSSKGHQLDGLRDVRDELAPWQRRLPPYAEQLKESLVDPTDLPGVDANAADYLQAYSAHAAGIVNTVGDLSDTLHSVVQDYQTELSNRQGDRINQLTVVATIFLPISVLTGYFGMNFQWLTNETMTFGSWLLLAVALPLALFAGSSVLLRQDGFASLRLPRRRRRKRKHPLKG